MVDEVCDNLTVNKLSNLLGNVGIGTNDPQAKLTVSGPNATVNIETEEILRLWSMGIPSVKNTNCASLCLGAFEQGISGRARLDINLSGILSSFPE
jgi:hypothetical protein